jgi:hypothetical protein
LKGVNPSAASSSCRRVFCVSHAAMTIRVSHPA